VVETPQGNLVAGMKWFLGTCSGRFNRRHQVFGHLFSGRYKALIVDGSGTGYLKTVCDYVHLNPARAKVLKGDEALRSYRWSSWPEYLKSPARRWPWLQVDRLLGEMGIPKDSAAGRRRLEEAVEARRGAGEGGDYKQIRRGWFLGGDALKQELLAQVSGRRGDCHDGDELRESAEARAERMVAEELKRRGWEARTLAARRKGDPQKVAIAQRLRKQTTLTLGWITERLGMGTKSHLAHLLYWHKRPEKHNTINCPLYGLCLVITRPPRLGKPRRA
jgi:putative transposase